MRAVLILFCTLAAFFGVELVLIAVHEGGHFLAGRLVGFQWRTCKVGPFQLTRGSGRWRQTQMESWVDGFIEFSLADSFAARSRWVLVLLSGSAANILLALGLYLYFFHLTPRAQGGEGWLFGIATFSFVIGLINLLPFCHRGGPSDGLWLCFLCLGGKEFREARESWIRHRAAEARYDTVTDIQDQLMEGIRPRSCDAFQIHDAIALRDGSRNESIACYYAYLWAADGGEPAAGQYLDRAVALRSETGEFGHTLLIEKAYWAALHERDAGTARDWLTQVGDAYHETSSYWRALAAISLADGDRTEAAKRARQARATLTPVDPSDRHLLDCFLTVGALTEVDESNTLTNHSPPSLETPPR